MAARWQLNYQLYRRYMRNLAIMYENREDIRTYVELLLTLSVIVIFALFAIRPTFVTVTELLTQVDSKKETIEKLDQKIDALTKAQDLFNQNRVSISLIDTAIPNEPLPDIYTRQFEGLTQKNETTVLNISVGEAKVFGSIVEVETPEEEAAKNSNKIVEVDLFPKDSSSLSYSSNVGGPYERLISLLKDIENTRRPLFIDDLTLRVADDEGIDVDLILAITGRTPYLTSE